VEVDYPGWIGQPARWPATVNSRERTRKPDTNAVTAMIVMTITTPKIIPVCKQLSPLRAEHDAFFLGS
jgi:hypothetical protein